MAAVASATTKTAKEWKPDDRDHDTALRSRKRDAALGDNSPSRLLAALLIGMATLPSLAGRTAAKRDRAGL